MRQRTTATVQSTQQGVRWQLSPYWTMVIAQEVRHLCLGYWEASGRNCRCQNTMRCGTWRDRTTGLTALNLKTMTCKLAAMLGLFSRRRVRTITGLRVKDCYMKDETCVFRTSDIQKTSKPGKHLNVIQFSTFKEEELCVVRHIKRYLQSTAELRKGDENFLISFVKLHGAVTVDTVRRWIRDTISAAGIDCNKYKPHSLRAASTSAAAWVNPMDEIMSAVGWSSAKTVARHYHKIFDKPGVGAAFVKGSVPVHKPWKWHTM